VKELPSPASIAAEFAGRLFGLAVTAKPQASESASATTANDPAVSPAPAPVEKKPEPPAKVAAQIQAFVSENDVRRAMTRSEKIFIGRKTILTPSARDLGLEHEVFVETEAGSIR
jgi:ethanolamine utilization cobalamin adenosyltransferase